MNGKFFFSATAWLTLALGAAASPKEDVLNAAKKLGDEANYSWKTTVVVPENAQFRPGPSEGQTEKDGFTCVSWKFGDNSTRAVIKGEKGAVTDQDGAWESLADAEKEEGFARFRALIVRNFKTPAVQAASLAAGTKDLTRDGEIYSGGLTEEEAKTLLRFGRRSGGEVPEVSHAQGSVKFWLKNGVLTKYEFKSKGTVSFNGNDREIDRTTTVEINDVGTTKVNVPEQARKKLS